MGDVSQVRIVILIIVYLIGLYIHFKIISVCRKVKDKTWQIDIVHSIGMVSAIGFLIVFEEVSVHFDVLSEHTGNWICYVATCIYCYVGYLGGFHTFFVALMKYVYIVHNESVRKFGKQKLKTIFLLIYIIHPFLVTLGSILTFDFEVFSSLIQCFGLQQQLRERYNSSNAAVERMFLCKLGADKVFDTQTMAYALRQGFCTVKMIWVMVLACNLPEGYLYFMIFRKMKR